MTSKILKYTLNIKACTNPSSNSPLAHFTNDYITFAEVNKSIFNEVGSSVIVAEEKSQMDYSNILLSATIVNGQLTSLEYSYGLKLNFTLKLSTISINGTGSIKTSCKYSNISY